MLYHNLDDGYPIINEFYDFFLKFVTDNNKAKDWKEFDLYINEHKNELGNRYLIFKMLSLKNISYKGENFEFIEITPEESQFCAEILMKPEWTQLANQIRILFNKVFETHLENEFENLSAFAGKTISAETMIDILKESKLNDSFDESFNKSNLEQKTSEQLNL